MRLIDADALKWRYIPLTIQPEEFVTKSDIEKAQTADVVSKELYDQVRYERDFLQDYAFERNLARWIPVEERLPGEGKDVLICFKEGHDCPHNRLQIAHLGTHDVEDKDLRVIGSERCWYTDHYYYWFKLNMVSAWMPLPEPWKGAEDDTE